ncbi:MAG: hypothetical protein NTW21_33820 [Verrucomicrobia bacterium]|nr:hypothetical protein [Verrucomicrobiota bacterium]
MDVKVGVDGGQRDAQGERGLEHAEAVAGAVDGAGEMVEITLHGAQRVVDVAGDFLGFLALEPEADGHALVGEGGADVFLLAAGGNVDVELFEGADVAADGAHVATEELGEVFLGEQAALLAGFLAKPPEAVLAQFVGLRDLFVGGVDQAQCDAGHRAVLEGHAGPGLDLHTRVKDLAVAQRGVAGGVEVNLADDFDDDLRLPGAHAGAADDLVDHTLILGLGGQTAGLLGE